MEVTRERPVTHADDREATEKLFQELKTRWSESTMVLSDPVEMSMDPNYQQIIGLGPAVVPLLLHELRSEPDHWFWALTAITREDPVAQGHRGSIELMAADWLEWADRHGYA